MQTIHAVWVDRKGTRYEKYAEPLSEEKLKTAVYDGPRNAEGAAVYDKPKDQGGKRIGTVVGGKAVRGFSTPIGKAELYTPSLATRKDATGKAVDSLPVYTPRDWQPDTEYPLYLINWKEANHTHTRTQNNAWLIAIKPDNPLMIHPETADRLQECFMRQTFDPAGRRHSNVIEFTLQFLDR